MPRNTTVFEWREDQDYGGEGWAPAGFPDFNVISADVMGHDVLEHFPRHRGTLNDEMMALGASIHCRILGGWFSSRGSVIPPEKHLGSDMGRFLHEMQAGILNMTEPRHVPKVDSNAETYIRAAVAEARHVANGEDNGTVIRASDPRLKHMAGWMRKGFAAAQRRWPHSPYAMSIIFDEIGERVRRCGEAQPGDKLLVTVDPELLEVKLKLKELSYEY